MFCYQCEQTANSKGCTVTGVCGKSAETANLQDELTSKIIEFANCVEYSEANISLIIETLFATITNVNFDNNSLRNLLEKISQRIQCCNSFDINSVWECNEDIRSLKSLILFGVKGIAAYAYHARVLGYKDETIDKFFFEALLIVCAIFLSEDSVTNIVSMLYFLIFSVRSMIVSKLASVSAEHPSNAAKTSMRKSLAR